MGSEYDTPSDRDLFAAVSQVAAILEAEARRVPRQKALPEFVEELRQDVIAAADKIGTKKSRVASREIPDDNLDS